MSLIDDSFILCSRENNIPLIISSSRYFSKEKLLLFVQDSLEMGILLLILTFIFSIAISFYHYGIEQGFFQESAVCGIKNFTENITKEDLLKQLAETALFSL